jgi:hypothetical protein
MVMEAHNPEADIALRRKLYNMTRNEMRDLIFGSDDLVSELVDVPEWGVTIELRTPTVARRGELISEFISENGKIDYVRMYPALVVSTACVPGTEEPLFSREDIEALANKSSLAMERLGKVAVQLSGLDDAAEKVEVGKESLTPILNSLTSTNSVPASDASDPTS